jgi:guanylate kinase
VTAPPEAQAAPLVLAAPSGAGKTTIARTLVERFPDFVFSVSATTRRPREGERDGVDYHFVSRERFEAMAANGELVEWAEVHGNLYGTPRRNLDDAAARGEHVVLDIDVQGAEQLRERVPEAVLVFVFPPSAEVLWSRLTARGTEDLDEVRRRLRRAREELARASAFDHVVVNDRLERAVAAVRDIAEGTSSGSGGVLDLEREVARLQKGIDDVIIRNQR